jgi:hypothetical protein
MNCSAHGHKQINTSKDDFRTGSSLK